MFDGLELVARAVAIDARTPFVRMRLPTLAIVAVVGYCSHAGAQERCPELLRLRAEAAAAIKPMTSAAPSDRCAAYNRFSMAWGAIAEYASDHRVVCDISIVSLDEFEKRYSDAKKARDNVCAGRPLRPYPPDVIER